MGVWFLTFFIIVIFIFSLYSSKFVFSPICLITLSYLVSILLIIPNIENWNVLLESKTVIIVIIGLLFFIIGYFISSNLKKNKIKCIMELKEIRCSLFSRIFNYLLNITAVVLIFIAVSNIVGQINLQNFGEKIGEYRLLNAYAVKRESIPGYLMQLYKISTISFYFMTYVFINNYLYRKKTNRICNIYIWDFIISLCCQISLSILSGVRYNIITCFIGIVTIITILSSSDKKSIKRVFSFKVYIKLFIGLILVVLLFSAMRELVGRTNQSDIFTYIAHYFGGSIPLLDKKLEHTIVGNDAFGWNTFFPIYRLLSIFGLQIGSRRGSLEFTSSGSLEGNVYTAFYTIYQDFGLLGICILEFIFGYICYRVYNFVYKNNVYKKKNIILIILYAMHVSCLYLNSYSDTFFNWIFSQTLVLEILYCLIIYKVYFDKKNIKLI